VLPRLRLRVTAVAETILRSGHPWLFAESVRSQNREGEPGELAVVYDRENKFLAVGLFDPDSPIRLRVLHSGKPETINREWWLARLDEALARRSKLFDANTTGFRWINGESDGWPGLVMDRYDRTLVLKLYTAGWLPWLEVITELVTERLQPERIVLRLSRNIQKTAVEKFGRADASVLHGPRVEGPILFLESGLRFEADVLRGQKTGFFLDQRENRRRVETLARGRSVLNAFSFSGGFSLYAARGGARSGTDLDISAHALAAARRSFALNQSDPMIAACPHESVQADAFKWLDGRQDRRFDLVILDPPSLARRESERAGAVRAYEQLAGAGIKLLERGGILLTCSCSAHVTAEEFFFAVRRAAGNSKREFAELQTTRHCPDHPATFPEAEYLKGIYLKV
jgi:23S rRNA (cytosine1962-C5)-methyltransferase